jgi:phosphinothricin acetyltransferase
MLVIRNAILSDLDSITDIYNDAILNTVVTFDTEIKTREEQEIWFKSHKDKNPILVAEEKGFVIGWAALSKYSTRCAYSNTAEISLYVRQGYQSKGIGKQLMKSIINEGKKAGLHVIIARITDGNKKSIHLHKSSGFEHIGILKEVGNKFGKCLDVYLMQKIYDD